MIWPFIHKTSIRLQVNPIECAAVVLGIALDYYGRSFSAAYLNSIVQVSRHGTDAASLIRAAHELGISAFAKHALVSDLKREKSLSILFVDKSHFVILEGYFLGHFYINDPALGRYKLTPLELRRRYSGVQIVLHASRHTAREQGSESFATNLGSLGFVTMGLFIGFLVLSFSSSISLTLITHEPWLLLTIVLIGIVLALSVLFFMAARLRSQRQRAEALCDWLVINIGKVSGSFFVTRPFGQLSNALKTFSSLRHVGRDSHISVALSIMLLTLITALGIMSFVFGLIAGALCLALLLLGFNTSEYSFEPPSSAGFDHFKDLSAMGQNENLVHAQMAEALRNELKEKSYGAREFAYVPIGLALVALFWQASRLIQAQKLSTPEVVSALLLLLILSLVTLCLAQTLKTRGDHQLEAFLQDVHEQASLKPLYEKPKASLVEIINGSFTYPGQAKPVLSSFNLSLKPSYLYSIKGGPLAGTSTLLRLLGQELAWSLESTILMSLDVRIALINDETDLFDSTLLENVRLFDQSINEHAVHAALKQACAEELFYNRPMGLLARIYAGGENLSGGQKKRLLLARALVHRPDLILLDNFFETIELPLALKIIKNLRSLGITTVFSSFRPAEHEQSDQVIILGESV